MRLQLHCMLETPGGNRYIPDEMIDKDILGDDTLYQNS